MILQSPFLCYFTSPAITLHPRRTAKATTSKTVGFCCQTQKPDELKGSKISTKDIIPLCTSSFCSCVTRRHLIEALGTAFLPIGPSFASASPPNNPTAMLNKFHPPRPDWYEELYASIMENGMKAYESEIAGVHVLGIDPNRKMEKYVLAAAADAGLQLENFRFMQAVAEALPLDDASVDAVVGTLVLCSVKDVVMTLQEIIRVLKPGGLHLFMEHVAAEDGTIQRYVQGILDPLQQIVADGCHLTEKQKHYC